MKIKFLFLLLFSQSFFAQINFNEYFQDKTLRFDYFHSGNNTKEFFTFDEFSEEPFWAGSRDNLIDTLGYGNFIAKVFDAKSNKLIYSHGYSVLFQEWQTTDEAKKISRTFTETIVLPYPKDSIRIELYKRDTKNIFQKEWEIAVNPKNYFIKKDKKLKYKKVPVHYTGDPSDKLDIVFLAEGYTKEERDKFTKDSERFSNYLFTYSPFDKMYNRINIWAVEAFSDESGTDIPADSVWKNTLLNSSFYTFDSERYLMTKDYKKVRDIAANAPYEQIYILVNTSKYGGGAIYNYYNVVAADNEKSRQIFIHEFGHGLAGLADEYFTSEVAYQDFYPLDVEPWEPNITTLVNFKSKWKNLVNNTISIPTPVEDAPENQIGAYEGAGYVAKGVYRSTPNSIMKSFTSDEFNEVSKKAIERVIKFYSK
jgi:hypothetical protein